MNKEQHDQAKKMFEALSKLEKSGTLTEEQQKEFSELKAQLAGVLLSSWLPADSGRKTIMLIIFLIAVLGAFMVNEKFLFFLLLLPFFFSKNDRRTDGVYWENNREQINL